jgi:cholesterol transport system auxiliary component
MRACLALAALVALGACTGSLFRSHSPAATTYLLSVAPPAAPVAELPMDVTVLMPRVRTGLDTDRIAVLYPDHRLDYFAAARWSGPLDETVQDLVIQALRADAHVRNAHTDTSAFVAGFWLEVDVVDFQAEYAAGSQGAPPTIHVRLLGRIGTAGDRRVLGQFEAQARRAAADERLTAIVGAFNEAVNEALAELVKQSVATLRAAPAEHPT